MHFGSLAEFVFTHTNRFTEEYFSFVNGQYTSDGGTHLSAFREGKTQILVGSQMIAKGLDNPNVTLVGVISADTGFSVPDFRASERGFQLLTQVAGRAGRADKNGQIILASKFFRYTYGTNFSCLWCNYSCCLWYC